MVVRRELDSKVKSRAAREPLQSVAPLDRLREAAKLGEVLGCVYQSQSYRARSPRRSSPSIGTIWRFAGAGDDYLQRAVELVDRL